MYQVYGATSGSRWPNHLVTRFHQDRSNEPTACYAILHEKNFSPGH